MSESPILLRPWKDGDEAGLLALQKLSQGEGELTDPLFFDWQYRQNPAGKAFIGCAQEPGGMIVANYTTIPVPISVGGIRMMASFAINALTHPDFRRLGLFTKCARCVFEEQDRAGIAFTFAFPTRYSYLGQIQKLSFEDLGQTQLLMKLHDLKAFLKERGFAQTWEPISRIGGGLLKVVQKKPRRRLTVEEVTSFEGLPLKNLFESTEVVVDIDAQWLNWRYCTNPRRQYLIVLARDSGGLSGLAVHRIMKSELRTWGIIMDLMLAPSAGSETVESLMNHIFAVHEQAGCAVTLFLGAPHSRKEALLKQCGFWSVPGRMRSNDDSTGVMLCRKNTPYNGKLALQDIDLSFGMQDTL